MATRRELQAKLLHGSQREIMRRTGKREDTICNWFAGRFNSKLIEAVVLEVVAEDVAKVNAREEKGAAALRGEKA